MKRISLKSVLVMLMFMLFSCNETVVTNIVHPDGSVTRRIVIKDPEGKYDNNYNPENYRVPFDSTWNITDSFEISEKGDTIWIRTAEKLFKNIEEINEEYKNDKGSNRNFVREARFSKKFHWFNTIYTFSENIDKTFYYGYPVEQYLTKQELEYFYLPESVLADRRNGPDSTNVRQIEDSVEYKSGKWMLTCWISEWNGEFQKLAEKKGEWDANKEFLKTQYSGIVNNLEKSLKDTGEINLDTIFYKILNNVFGDELYVTFRPEIDSSVKVFVERFETANKFEDYSVRTLMPGKLVATNGFIDQNGEILWPAKMKFFLVQPYEMWAESKTSNTWAWVVSGLFLLFVITGLVFRIIKKSGR